MAVTHAFVLFNPLMLKASACLQLDGVYDIYSGLQLGGVVLM